MTMSPTEPLRADHRVIRKILDTSSKGKVLYLPSEFDVVSSVFVESGGSWFRLFEGSMDELGHLKEVIKIGVKEGFLTKKGSW